MKKSIIIILIIILVILTRFVLIDLRPLHHDESVNFFFAKKIINGEGFNYDSTNYHGPLYFFLLATSFFYLGISEFSLRLPTLIFSIFLLIIIILIDYKNKLYNEVGKYVVAFFIIFSPSLFYYGRYSIHESVFLFFTFLSVYFYYKILEEKSLDNLPYFAICLALLFTLKETTIIILFLFFILSLINIKKIFSLTWEKSSNKILISLILFLIIYITLFTSFFTNPNGLKDSFKAYLPWINRGITEIGHDKPFYYYTILLYKYELPLLILGILGVYYSFKKKEFYFKTITIWFLIIYLIYSLIPYKTPWLIINITLPLCILSGISLISIHEKNKRLSIFIFSISLFYLIISSIYLNFFIPYQEQNKFAYAHTDKNILNLVNNLTNTNSTIYIISHDYWPLPFYLRDKNILYINPDSFKNKSEFLNKTLIVDKKTFEKFNPKEYNEFVLRPRLNLYLIKNYNLE